MKRSISLVLSIFMVMLTVMGTVESVQAASSLDRYTDINKKAYYAAPVEWALDEGIASGTSKNKFEPDKVCSRAEIITFLWKASGSPEPYSTQMPFKDVSKSASYAKAVLWALEEGITSGTSETTFSPKQTVTRAQAMTFLWKVKGSPGSSYSIPFKDVSKSAYYLKPVRWAVEKGITSGTSAKAFSPNNGCTRAHVLTFLYNCYYKSQLTNYIGEDISAVIHDFGEPDEELYIDGGRCYYFKEISSYFFFQNYSGRGTTVWGMRSNGDLNDEYDLSGEMTFPQIRRRLPSRYRDAIGSPEGWFSEIDGRYVYTLEFKLDSLNYQYMWSDDPEYSDSLYVWVMDYDLLEKLNADNSPQIYISEDEAYALACKWWGYSPGESEWSLVEGGIVEHMNYMYYEFYLKQRVYDEDGGFHYSTIDYLYINTETGEGKSWLN